MDAFEPAAIEESLRQYVLGVDGRHWEDIVERLRERMHWEYEGLNR